MAAAATWSWLVADKNARGLGFDNPEELKAAQPADPFDGVIVRLDELQRYESGSDVEGLPLRQVIEAVAPASRRHNGLPS